MARFYKNWISAYLEHTKHQESPDQFHFWTAVSTVAGALRRQVWLKLGYFEWTPNFYIIFVAKPGVVSKSTSIDVGMSILRKLEWIKFGPNAITWQALAADLEAATELVDMGGGNFEPMSALTIAASELGTLLNPKDREMVDVLTDLWDSRRGLWKKRTKLNGDNNIENPWINIIACTTPHWIAENVPESMIGGGFASRCVFVYATGKRFFVAYPDENIPTDFEETKARLVHDLELIAQCKGAFTISPEARQWGRHWYEELQTITPAHLQTERAGAYLARKQTMLHKLAMVLSCAERSDLIIEKDHLQQAEFHLKSLEKDMEKVFSRIGRSHDAAVLDNFVSEIIRHGGKISNDELMRIMLETIDFDLYKKTREAACLSGFAKAVNTPHGVMLELGPHKKVF